MPIGQELRPPLWDRLGRTLVHTRRTTTTGERIANTGDRIDRIFFPVGSICALGRHIQDSQHPYASGMVGHEGMIGACRFLGNTHWNADAFVVIGGDMVEVPVDGLLRAIETDPALHDLINRYIHNYQLQLAQNAMGNLAHSVEQRLARWLVMIHDRSASDDLRLTHETLATLLNVRRASVTDTLHVMEGERLVRCTRGQVTVRDRAGLQRLAGHFYGDAEADYNATIGPFGYASPAHHA